MRILSLALVIVVGCSTISHSDPASAQLRIQVSQREVRTGDELVVSYTLSNTGRTPMKSCLTFKEGYDLWGSKSVKQRVNAVDHPSCVESFTLAPQESITWTSTLSIPDVGQGEARFSG